MDQIKKASKDNVDNKLNKYKEIYDMNSKIRSENKSKNKNAALLADTLKFNSEAANKVHNVTNLKNLKIHKEMVATGQIREL